METDVVYQWVDYQSMLQVERSWLLRGINRLLKQNGEASVHIEQKDLGAICACCSLIVILCPPASKRAPGTIIGMAALIEPRKFRGTDGFVEELIIAERYRDGGLERGLMDEIIHRARELRIERLLIARDVLSKVQGIADPTEHDSWIMRLAADLSVSPDKLREITAYELTL